MSHGAPATPFAKSRRTTSKSRYPGAILRPCFHSNPRRLCSFIRIGLLSLQTAPCAPAATSGHHISLVFNGTTIVPRAPHTSMCRKTLPTMPLGGCSQLSGRRSPFACAFQSSAIASTSDEPTQWYFDTKTGVSAFESEAKQSRVRRTRHIRSMPAKTSLSRP